MPKRKLDSTDEEKVKLAHYSLDDQIGVLLRGALRRHTSIFTDKMTERLTPTQFSALAKLYEIGPCSQNYLGRLTNADAPTIKEVVDRLLSRGLIASSIDLQDRRLRNLELTRAGRKVAEEAILAGTEITANTMEPLSTWEQRTLVRILKKIR